jgi:hypothetical protein
VPKLGSEQIEVHFGGDKNEELWVCGWLKGSFRCVGYKRFMEELKNQYKKDEPSSEGFHL